MPRKRYKPEEIVARLRQVDVLVLAGAELGLLGGTWSTGSIARKASAARLAGVPAGENPANS